MNKSQCYSNSIERQIQGNSIGKYLRKSKHIHMEIWKDINHNECEAAQSQWSIAYIGMRYFAYVNLEIIQFVSPNGIEDAKYMKNIESRQTNTRVVLNIEKMRQKKRHSNLMNHLIA